MPGTETPVSDHSRLYDTVTTEVDEQDEDLDDATELTDEECEEADLEMIVEGRTDGLDLHPEVREGLKERIRELKDTLGVDVGAVNSPKSRFHGQLCYAGLYREKHLVNYGRIHHENEDASYDRLPDNQLMTDTQQLRAPELFRGELLEQSLDRVEAALDANEDLPDHHPFSRAGLENTSHWAKTLHEAAETETDWAKMLGETEQAVYQDALERIHDSALKLIEGGLTREGMVELVADQEYLTFLVEGQNELISVDIAYCSYLWRDRHWQTGEHRLTDRITAEAERDGSPVSEEVENAIAEKVTDLSGYFDEQLENLRTEIRPLAGTPEASRKLANFVDIATRFADPTPEQESEAKVDFTRNYNREEHTEAENERLDLCQEKVAALGTALEASEWWGRATFDTAMAMYQADPKQLERFLGLDTEQLTEDMRTINEALDAYAGGPALALSEPAENAVVWTLVDVLSSYQAMLTEKQQNIQDGDPDRPLSREVITNNLASRKMLGFILKQPTSETSEN